MKAVDDGVPYAKKLSKDEILKTTDKCVLIDPGRGDLLYCMHETSTPQNKSALKSYYCNNEDTIPFELINAGVQHLEGLTEVKSVTNEDNIADVVVAGVAAVSFADADPATALSQAKRNFKLSVDRVRTVLQDKHTFSKLNMDEKQRMVFYGCLIIFCNLLIFG
ncbi:hypothetical protein K7432_004811 [Basidiobolus ranarum]|uniref:Uncharacterized protein n=1 Tax=Basidiobolus ranarum TaxID=34480 RepID=A0ABR2WXK4_9FUNG